MKDNLPFSLPDDTSDAPVPSLGVKTTPMMEQYLEIKQQHPSSLVFYRMGDFYELFFKDAALAAEALDISLTSRGKHMGQDIPMCGVPVHSAETYLHRLIRKGFRVVVCEQTGESVLKSTTGRKKHARTVMSRQVVRIVTPGTLTEENLLEAKSHNFLAALALAREDCALAWADVSTGTFYTREMPTADLHAELARLAPGELLIPESALTFDLVQVFEADRDGVTTPLAEQDFSATLGAERLARMLQVASLEAIAPYTKLELEACGALVGYIEITQVGKTPALEAPKRLAQSNTMGIDPATRKNLELIGSISGGKKDSLLGAIDKTLTGAGGRTLKEYLMAPLLETAEINARFDAIEFLIENETLSAQLRALLRRVPDMARALGRLSLARGAPRDLAALRDGLHTAHAIKGELAAQKFPQELPQTLQQAVNDIGSLCADLESHLQSVLVERPPAHLREGGMVATGYDAALDEQRKFRDDSRRIIVSLQKRYAQEVGIQTLKIRYNRILDYYIEVPANAADKLTQEPLKQTFIHRQTMSNAMRFSTAELVDLSEKIQNSDERTLDMERAIFEKICTKVLEAASAIKTIAAALARVDVFTALAEVARSEEYTRPKVDDSNIFDIHGGRHPIVEGARTANNKFVPNDCALNLSDVEDSSDSLRVADKRIWLLTGPNMAGKSTFLRQNALIAILAQAGCFVPAKHAHIGVVDRVFSRVGAADDLAGGRSTFMVEMMETATILNQATDKSLVILDEIGRGTATFDGLAIAGAVVEYLHDVNRCRAIFATHYHELTELREQLDGLDTVTMRSREWQGDIIFLHEVVRGAADGSYGIQVARLAGLPDHTIKRAREKLDVLEAQGQQSKPLFSSGTKTPKPSAREHPALAMLEKISPDQFSPREALDMLYQLQSLINDDKKS